VLENGGSEDEAIAALLHDAPEDQGGLERLADIRTRFGDSVAEIVVACTDTFESPKPPWRERKEQYLAALRTKPEPALRVSLADKLHNARALLRDYEAVGDDLFERFNAGKEDQCWYYSELAAVFTERLAGDWMAAEFRAVVDRLRRLWAPGESSTA
jgi:(p)ppGpp synthase/HD superfamily hydrolase